MEKFNDWISGIEEILLKFNSYDPHIKFTVEREFESGIPCLEY